MKSLKALAAAILLAVAWGELVDYTASRRLVGADRGGSEAIVVLGFRNRHPHRANALNRWRVRAGLRSIDPQAPASRVVFSGFSRHAEGLSEAALMARYATDELGFDGDVVLEQESRSTWQNIENVRKLIADVDRIKIVSNPLHGQKARMYLHRQDSRLAERLVRAKDYRLGEWALLKPLFAGRGLLDLAKAKRNLP